MTLTTPGSDDAFDDEASGYETAPRRRTWLSYALIALGVVVIALIGKGFASLGAVKNAHAGRPPAPVAVARVVAADMPVTLAAVGTVTPVETAIVKSQLSGNVFAIRFYEGQLVHQGEVIAEIDPRPFRLQLQQAEGALARDTAQLEVARADLARYQKLAAQDSIARQQLDTQLGTVHQLEGTVAADRAGVGTARLDIDYAAVKAPITGRIGLKQISIGSYVTPGDANGIATVTRTDPIDVQFALPQSALGQVRRQAAGASGGADSGLPVTAFDQDNVTVLAKGHFATLDNQVATATGTISAKARFANPGDTAHQALFPNQFVNVRLLVDTLHHVPIVPVSALRHGAPGDFVYVVQPDQTVKLTVVKTGASDGVTTAVLAGLAPGQLVVTEGADGLDDGAKVRLPRGGGAGGNGGGGDGSSGVPAGAAASGGAGAGAGAGAWSGHPGGGKHHHHADADAAE